MIAFVIVIVWEPKYHAIECMYAVVSIVLLHCNDIVL